MFEKPASPSPHNHLIDKIAVLNAVLSAVALYPQLYDIVRYGADTAAISRVSFGLILSNSLIWFWYGYHRKIVPLMLSSLLNTIAAGLILFFTY